MKPFPFPLIPYKDVAAMAAKNAPPTHIFCQLHRNIVFIAIAKKIPALHKYLLFQAYIKS